MLDQVLDCQQVTYMRVLLNFTVINKRSRVYSPCKADSVYRFYQKCLQSLHLLHWFQLHKQLVYTQSASIFVLMTKEHTRLYTVATQHCQQLGLHVAV